MTFLNTSAEPSIKDTLGCKLTLLDWARSHFEADLRTVEEAQAAFGQAAAEREKVRIYRTLIDEIQTITKGCYEYKRKERDWYTSTYRQLSNIRTEIDANQPAAPTASFLQAVGSTMTRVAQYLAGAGSLPTVQDMLDTITAANDHVVTHPYDTAEHADTAETLYNLLELQVRRIGAQLTEEDLEELRRFKADFASFRAESQPLINAGLTPDEALPYADILDALTKTDEGGHTFEGMLLRMGCGC